MKDPEALPRSAYIHVPFCEHKCGYCDFASYAGIESLTEEYVDAVSREFALVLGEPREVDTIFIGGGTPTYLPAKDLASLLAAIRSWLPLAEGGEWTIEANPNTLDATKVNVLADHGVNRVSLGAQSFHPHLLRALERTHDPANVERAVSLCRPRIDNLSLDVIFGIPGQRIDDWCADLECVLALQPQHLSAYGLTYEKGTKLWKDRRLGIVTPVEEDAEREMMEWLVDRLGALGWDHYEISNFASPDNLDPNNLDPDNLEISRSAKESASRWRCRHNQVYWANEPCWGFGNGAAGYVGGTRNMNIRDPAAYIQAVRSGRRPVAQSETLEPEHRARETAMLQLRRLEGIDRTRFAQQTGFSLDDLAGPAIRRAVQLGLLADSGDRVHLTGEGLFVADGVLAAML